MSILTGTTIDSHAGAVDSAGNVTFGIADPLGSTLAVTDSNGNLGATLYDEPYGETTGSGPVAFPFAFTGRIPIVGNIYYYRNRFYDAGTGRFLSEDPIGYNATDSNLYRYVSSSPVNSGSHWSDQGAASSGGRRVDGGGRARHSHSDCSRSGKR